jgi:type IV pilus assembly protein PilO
MAFWTDRPGRRERVLLTALLTLGLGFCLYIFILAPQARAYLSTRQELENARNKLASYRATAAALRDESEKLEKARAQAAILGKQFASDIRKGEDIVLLGLEAASRNVDITGVEPGGIREQKYTLEMPLKISVEGDFRDVLDFCRSLEKGALHNLTEIRGINMEGTDTPGRVKAEFSVVLYADRSPGSRLKLEEMGRWLTGRYNIFAPADGTAPVPELSGRLKGLPAPPGAGSSPASPAAGNTPELTGQDLPSGEKGTVAGEVYYFNK